jgi:hypothetical protein
MLKDLSQFLGLRDLSLVQNLPGFGNWLLLAISELISHLEKYDHTITQLEKFSDKREWKRESTLFHAQLVILPLQSRLHLFEWTEEEKLLRGLSQSPFGVTHSRTCGCFLQSNRNGFDLRYHKSAPRSVL